MKTVNNIVTSLEDFVKRHQQLRSFFSGDTWDFQAKTNIYPALCAVIMPSEVHYGKQVISYNIFIADICNKDKSNVDEIWSDTMQIFSDLYAEFRDNYDTYGFYLEDDNLSLTPWNEDFDDILAGWNGVLRFSIPYSGSICNIPID